MPVYCVVGSGPFPARTRGLFTWYQIEFDPEWKTKFGTVFTWKCFRTNSYSNEAKQSREPAKGQQKTKEKQDYACADRDVRRSCSGMNFGLRLHDSGIGSRTGMKVSIRNENRCELDLEWHQTRSRVMWTLYAQMQSYKRGNEETGASSFRIETRSGIM